MIPDTKARSSASVLLVFAVVILMFIPLVYSYRTGPNDWEWFINDPPPTSSPNYPPTRTTGYWIALEEDWPSWYAGAAKKTGKTGCKIPVSERGFYEDVLCEGSGVTNDGKIARYTTIKTTREATDLVEPHVNTNAKKPPPRPRRTIARVRNPDSPCYIPLWSRVYIKYQDPSNPHTGWYIAEDSGGGFQGQFPYCKIDIFLGIGKQRPLGTVSPTVPLNEGGWRTHHTGAKYSPGWPEVWVFPGERDDRAYEDNVVTYLLGEPVGRGLPSGEGGVSGAAPPGTPSPLPGQPGYRPTHPYFNVPYSVNPSFSTSIPYDFSVYDDIPEKIRRLERCRDNIDCIKNNASLIEAEDDDYNWILKYGGNVISKEDGVLEYPAWEAFCETPDQHAVNSLAEALDVCARSQENDCVCPYKLPVVTSADLEAWYGRAPEWMDVPVIGPLLGLGSLIAIEALEDWDERILAISQSGSNIRVIMREPGNPEPIAVPSASFRRVDPSVAGESSDLLSYEMSDRGRTLHIYKDNHNNLSIYSEGAAPSSEECELHNKMVKFCILQDKTFFAYNSEENKMGIQNLVLKFAYLFRSEVTDVRNFEVRDMPFASNRSLLVWDPVSGVDVSYYTVYYSEDSSMEGNLRDQEPGDLSSEHQAALSMEQLYVDSKQDINLALDALSDPSCIISTTSCLPGYRLTTAISDEMSDVLVDESTLYYSTVDEKFFYILPDVRNDHHYYFGITATDVNGDESPSFNQPVEGKHDDSEDDLPPGIAEVVLADVNPETDRVEVTINAIDYNIDGSTLDPFDISSYKIYCFGEGEAGDFDLAQRESIFAQSPQTDEGGSVSFTARRSDFNAGTCGFGSAPNLARIVVTGVKRVRGSDVDYRGNVTESSFSSQTLMISSE